MKAKYQIVPSKAVIRVEQYLCICRSHKRENDKFSKLPFCQKKREIFCLVAMNMFARLDEIPAITLSLQDIKETKRYGLADGRTDSVKTVQPPQTKFTWV